MENFELTNLIGKTVSFGTDSDNLAITNISFKLINEKIFVFGIIPYGATKNDSGVGKECAIAWDSITDFMVFETEQEYTKFMVSSED